MRSRKRKVKKLSKTKRNGGKLIAQGANGCTYGPAIRCIGEPNRRKGVSKLLKMRTALEEADMVARVKEIDPTMKYSVFWSDSCEPDFKGRTPEEIEEDEGGEKCRLSSHPDVLLTGPYGGMALKEVQDPKTLAVSLMNAFIGLNEYHKNNFVHTDIKDDNLLYFERRARFIDFGNSNSFKKMAADEKGVKRYISDIGAIAWPSPHIPPELSLLYENFDNGERYTREAFEAILRSESQRNNETNPERYDYNILYDVYPKTEEEAIKLAKTVDMYQMGILLYTLIDDNLLSFDLMDDIEEFGSTLANKDPRKRPTAEQAMQNFAKLMGISLQKYMPVSLVTQSTENSSILKKLQRQDASRNLIVATAPPALSEPAMPVYKNPFAPAPPAKFVPPVYKNPFENTDKKMFALRQLLPNAAKPKGSGKKTKKRRVRFS